MPIAAMGFDMIVDSTITIGNIIEISVIGFGGIGAIIALRNTVGNMKNDLTDLKAEIKKLGEIMIDMADIRGELKVSSNRITACEQDIRELRHGNGFVQRDVNGEYPK